MTDTSTNLTQESRVTGLLAVYLQQMRQSACHFESPNHPVPLLWSALPCSGAAQIKDTLSSLFFSLSLSLSLHLSATTFPLSLSETGRWRQTGISTLIIHADGWTERHTHCHTRIQITYKKTQDGIYNAAHILCVCVCVVCMHACVHTCACMHV